MTKKSNMESVNFYINCNKEQSVVSKKDIEYILGTAIPEMDDNDILELTYHIFIDYVGEVRNKLDAILRLLNTGAKGTFKELRTGKCLINDILTKIKQIERR